MLTIKNLTKRTIVFNLPHDKACSDTVCTCSRVKAGVVDLDPKTGDRKVRAVNQRLAHAITLFPKGTLGDAVEGQTERPSLDTVTDLLDGVGRVPEVAQARARGEISWTHTPDTKAEPAADTKTKKAAAAAVKE